MLTIKASHVVKPANPTPDEFLYLSECDQIMALSHAPTIYFYRPSAQILELDPIKILKDSLPKALEIFYPLAGRLRWAGHGRVTLHCNSAGALLVDAESDAKIDDFEEFCPTPEIRALIPSADLGSTALEEVPLLLVQITKFRCGGLSLGLAMSHTIIDGESALHFVSEWARIARGENVKEFPFLDRKILQPKNGGLILSTKDYAEFAPTPVLIGHSDSMEERRKATTTVLLKLSKEQVEKLKKNANKYLDGQNNGSEKKFSRYESVSAHLWRCSAKARMHTAEQETAFYIYADFRHRLNPPLPQKYFGNAVMLVPVLTTAGDLLLNPLGYAASKIREAGKMVTDEYVNSFMTSVKNLSDVSYYRNFHTVGCSRGAFLGNPNISVTSWLYLPLYGADFGWGKEIYMGPGALGYDGKCFLLPSMKGDGSVILPLRLQVEHMDAFQKLFYEEIDCM